MKASIMPQENGNFLLHLDPEAAQAAFASIVFASHFHEDIVPLARIVEGKLQTETRRRKPGRTTCR
jgi:hypothetical protein